MSVEQTILAKLANGPMWLRSFGATLPAVRRMIDGGQLERCRLPNGRAMNMVRIAADKMRTLDHFAEHLSEHGNVARAAHQVGVSDSYGRVLLQRLIAELGPQAR